MTDPPEMQLARRIENAALSVANSPTSLIARGRKEAASLGHDDEQRKIAAIRTQAELGEVEAQYDLAEALASVHVFEGVKFLPNPRWDEAEAVHWYRLAAEQGHRDAQYELGRRYAKGLGVSKDDTEAGYWLSRAANLGHLQAIVDLVCRDLDGIGSPLDGESSVRLRLRGADIALAEAGWDFDLAITPIHWGAEIGHTSAQYFLGDWYSGDDCWPTKRNYEEAAKWYKLAAEQGLADAQNSLGVMYANGHGVPQDYKEAVRWCKLAAEQGYAIAQFNCGMAYANGHGVPQDYVQAHKWYKLAAEQGYANAQINLGFMYGEGRGVPQDYVQAHMWFNLAGAAGTPEGVKNRDVTAALMTPAQTAEAQRLAREWKPKKAK